MSKGKELELDLDSMELSEEQRAYFHDKMSSYPKEFLIDMVIEASVELAKKRALVEAWEEKFKSVLREKRVNL